MKSTQRKAILESIYKELFGRFGPQKWWPADTKFEVIVGAILTQNTAWTNVEKALQNLKNHKLLSPQSLRDISEKRLGQLIKPAGYYNVKAQRLKDFINFLFERYGGNLNRMFKTDFLKLRAELLSINGIGLETADSILLYAGEKPLFVVDAYTRRILARHHLIEETATYSEIQNLFMNNLSHDIQLFNEYHALIVRLGKEICKKMPRCHICPLKQINKEIKHACDSCGRKLEKPQSRHVLKIELFVSPEVEFTEQDMRKDAQEELKDLLKQMKQVDPKQLEEDIYVSYQLTLCKRCRDTFNKRIKYKEFV
ncbi:endonuclease III domain-containing protein [Candidatus Omnitrophota bacterium]